MTPEVKKRIEQIRYGNVPVGYKHTAVGVIPAEWRIHSVSDHLTESCIPGSTGDVAKKITVKLWNKGVVEKREVHAGSENTQYYKRKKGQFIYSKLDFLNCAFGIVPEELDGYESTLDLPAFDIDGIEPYYLLSQVTQRRFYERWGVMAANGGRKARRISPDDFLSFPIAFPCLEEQKRIAKILTTQDKVIELKEKLLAEKLRQKKYLMQQLLTGKKRLHGFNEEWKAAPIGKFLESRNTKQVPCEEAPLMAFVAGEGVTSKSERYDRSHLVKDDAKKYKRTELNDFIYSSNNLDVGSIGLNKYGTAVISVVYEIFKAKDNVVPAVISEVIQMPRNLQHILSYRQGAFYGQYRIFAEDFLSVPIWMPGYEEQVAIGKVLDAADREIELLRQDLEQEKQKKKALMQLLLTGIVRVNV